MLGKNKGIQKCQKGRYQIDQLDSDGSDAFPDVSDQGSLVGIASAPAPLWIFSSRLVTVTGRNEIAVGRGLVGGGAANSRSHRLSLALPWQQRGRQGCLDIHLSKCTRDELKRDKTELDATMFKFRGTAEVGVAALQI